jgi:hypothetical protein
MSFSKCIFKLINHRQRDSGELRTRRRNRLRHLAIEVMEERRLLTTIDLAALSAAQGAIVYGVDEHDWSGFSVSSAGDVNGDGFDDLGIGAMSADGSGNSKNYSGESYVIFGGPTLTATVDLANLGAAGITIFGVDAYDRSGQSVSGAGDINGDGFDDLVIGSEFAAAMGNLQSNAGESHVIFGGPSLPPTIDLANLGSLGITIFGADAYDHSGVSVNSVGDFNGDGFGDLIIGAANAAGAGNTKSGAGESYLIYGGPTFPPAIELANLGSAGVTIYGREAYDFGARSVSGAGDVNGDGFDDLAIGADSASAAENSKPRAGESYIIFGSPTSPPTIDLANTSSSGITIYGADAHDHSGVSVNSVGDVNGDGFDDLIIGADRADAMGNGKTYAGDSYLIFGGAALSATIDLANLGAAGISIFGGDAFDLSGHSVSGAGDVNGDGFDDLLIGAEFAAALGNAKPYAGESFVIFGGPSLPATMDLADLGASGISIFGADGGDHSGGSVSNAGDVNGDGFDDLIIGAHNGDAQGNNKSHAGESYVIFGADFTRSVTHPGTTAGDVLFGNAAADVMIGGRGDDVLVGNGGADVLRGGEGNDILAIGDLAFQRIFGGNGLDTLRLDSSGLVFDLTTLADNRILGIEQIDITGSGDNTLTLDLLEVLNISDESNTLIVSGDNGDQVLLDSGWTHTADETIHSVSYRVLISGEAILKVASEITLVTPTLTIDLAALSAAQGAIIYGVDEHDWSGFSVDSAGDVNGDGFDDLVIGAKHAATLGNVKPNAGESYLIFGGPSLPSTIDLANLGPAGITIFGVDAGDLSGRSVGSAGDMNGDGFDDLVIGAIYAAASGNLQSNAGESYVIFGSPSLPPTIDLADLGAFGMTIFGVDADDLSGISVSTAGDVNGDGFDDMVIGAMSAAGEGNSKTLSGESYLIFGSPSLPASIHLANLDSNGIVIFGASTLDRSGHSVSSAGDVNGDGFNDLAIGAIWAAAEENSKPNAGESYVIFGGPTLSPTIDLANLGAAGMTIFGADGDDWSGFAISNAGDVNGDNFGDLIIGAFRAAALENGMPLAGESYLIFGGTSLPATIDLASLGSAGITVFGADAADQSGGSVSGAGDVNGDGFDDLLIGAEFAAALGNAKPYAGESYVIFGGPSLPATMDLADLGASGISIFGADGGDHSGGSVSNAGDVNGDGFDDLIIGAHNGDAQGNNKSHAGESYVIFGADFTGSVTHPGTTAGDVLFGNAAADVMIGGRGDDVLVGNGGADVLRGGEGNDILAIGDLAFQRIFGGNGLDTLRLDSSGLIFDLTTLADNRILGIEQLDITGSGDNTLTLDLLEVLNISDESNTLIVRRDIGDLVNIGSGWIRGNNEVIGDASFEVFIKGPAVLKVQSINESPTDIALSSNFVLENAIAIANDVTIGTLTAVDPDAGDTHSFALINGVGPNDNTFFSVIGDELSIKAGTVIDFEAKPNYVVHVQATDSQGSTFAKDLLVMVGNRGELAVVTIGDGTAQRSKVTGLTVIFDSEVNININAFTVIKQGVSGGTVDVSFGTMVDGQGRTVASLTFSGAYTEFGSLVDGNYELQIDGSEVTDVYGNVDLDEDGTDGGTYRLGEVATDEFFRLFGDVSGDRSVGLTEFNLFRATFGKNQSTAGFNPSFDFNGDNVIGLSDFNQFRGRFGMTL